MSNLTHKKLNSIEVSEAIILCRVSSKNQEDGFSLDAQEDRLRAYCQRKNLAITDIYRITESSTRGGRPKFMEMIKAIKKRNTPVALVCDKVDRLARGFKEAPILESLRQSGKIELHFNTENRILNYKSNSSELMTYNFLIMMAQKYTDDISDNVKRSHERMIKEGRITGPAVIGYENYRDEHDNACIMLDSERAFLVKRLFVEYATGLYSLDMLKDMAKEWGLRNKRSGKPLPKSQIANILKDKFYCGYATFKGHEYKHAYPTLIDVVLFHRCELVRKGKLKNHSNKTKREYIFTGLIHCKNCGCTVTPDIKKDKYIYLKPNTKKGCNCKQINENVANKIVEDTLKGMAIPKKTLEKYVTKLHEKCNQNHVEEIAQLKFFNKELEQVKNRIDRLTDVYLDGDIDKSTYEKKKTEFTFEKDRLENKIKNFNANSKEIEINAEYLLTAISKAFYLYQSSRIDKKRKILKLVFSNFWLDGEKIGCDIKKPFDMFVKRSCCSFKWSKRGETRTFNQ